MINKFSSEEDFLLWLRFVSEIKNSSGSFTSLSDVYRTSLNHLEILAKKTGRFDDRMMENIEKLRNLVGMHGHGKGIQLFPFSDSSQSDFHSLSCGENDFPKMENFSLQLKDLRRGVKNAVSFTKLMTLEECPMKFFFRYIQKLDMHEPLKSSTMGVALHKAAHEINLAEIEGRNVDIDVITTRFQASVRGQFPKHHIDQKTEELKTYAQRRASGNERALGSESGFTIGAYKRNYPEMTTPENGFKISEKKDFSQAGWKAIKERSPSNGIVTNRQDEDINQRRPPTLKNDWILTGNPDRVDITPEGKVCITEIKSKMKYNEKASDSKQLKFYALAYFLKNGSFPDLVKLECLKSRTEDVFQPTPEWGLTALEWIEWFGSQVTNGVFEANPGQFCYSCPYRRLCPQSTLFPSESLRKCQYCGMNRGASHHDCPAYHHVCRKCGESGHFQVQCSLDNCPNCGEELLSDHLAVCQAVDYLCTKCGQKGHFEAKCMLENLKKVPLDCLSCGDLWDINHSKTCPALDHNCTKCGMKGHFETQCLQQACSYCGEPTENPAHRRQCKSRKHVCKKCGKRGHFEAQCFWVPPVSGKGHLQSQRKEQKITNLPNASGKGHLQSQRKEQKITNIPHATISKRPRNKTPIFCPFCGEQVMDVSHRKRREECKAWNHRCSNCQFWGHFEPQCLNRRTCTFCGERSGLENAELRRNHRNNCPAKNKKCHYCGLIGHFTAQCRQRITHLGDPHTPCAQCAKPLRAHLKGTLASCTNFRSTCRICGETGHIEFECPTEELECLTEALEFTAPSDDLKKRKRRPQRKTKTPQSETRKKAKSSPFEESFQHKEATKGETQSETKEKGHSEASFSHERETKGRVLTRNEIKEQQFSHTEPSFQQEEETDPQGEAKGRPNFWTRITTWFRG